MPVHNLLYPVFDHLELTEALELTFESFKKLSPAKAGSVATDLQNAYHPGRWHKFFDEIILDTNSHAFRYEHKPLLLYFYEEDWAPVANEHLRQLNAIQNELRHWQINTLVITAKSLQSFLDVTWADGLSLQVYEDTDNELAGLLGLHADDSPAWSQYAGIERNIALPGLYLLDGTRQIAFAHANEDILQTLPLQKLINELPAQEYEHRRSA
jgi:peroxiredoxin